jgi:hypothetical protein
LRQALKNERKDLTQRRKDAKEDAKKAAWSPAGFASLRLCVRNLLNRP